MSDDIKPRVDEDGLLNCDQKCQHFRTENRTLTGVERDLCAQSCAGDICPVAARRNAALLRECRNLLAEVWIHPWTIDSSKEYAIRALLERIGE